jgi:putative inorganic carbon (hco3(-)) transporter
MALRELLLILIVAVLCCAALFRPRIGVYSYVWYAVMRPDVLAWCADQYNFSMALAAATMIGALPYAGQTGVIFRNPISRWLVILQIPLLASTLLAVNPDLSYDRYLDFLKSLVILLLIPVFVRTAEHLKQLLLVVGISVAVIGVKFGLFGLIHGGVILINGYGGQMSDNNLVALALVMSVPLCWYGLGFIESTIVKLIIAGMMLCSIAAIPMTNSRGATLALASVFLSITARSKRKIGTFAILVVAAGSAIYLVRDQYLSRMATIATYEQEASASSRVEHAEAAIKMWLDHPLIGVGFGGRNYVQLSAKYLGRDDIHVVHNTYLQMLVDSGVIAFLIYTGLLWGTIVWLIGSGRKMRWHCPGEEKCAIAMQASLLAFAIGGTFYSSQRYDLPYIILMAAASWYLIVHNEPFESEAEYEEYPYKVAAQST